MTTSINTPIMTKFEYTRIRGIRLQQLSDGMKPYVPVYENDTYVDIFKRELAEHKIPLKIIRKIGYNKTIAIPVSDMNINKYN
jgi:DNA-directed RNA polymerase subunit K/omega